MRSFFHIKLAQFKLVISDSKGKSLSRDLRDKSAQPLLGSKIGDILDSSIIGMNQGKIKITGGSDKSGTPMRQDIHGGVKKYALLSKGVGMRAASEGARIRKLIRGNMVTEEIFQLNCRLIDADLQEKASESSSELDTSPTKNGDSDQKKGPNNIVRNKSEKT
jgi:small subunit ribosomal protein S6e